MPAEPTKPGVFPETRWSAIAAARSNDSAERRLAIERIADGYWKPVYKYIRAKWKADRSDAEDLTQEFFARVIEKDFLANFDPAKGRLRTFLRVCIDGLVQNHRRAASAQKRGGDAAFLSLDFNLAEEELVRSGMPATEDMDSFFDKEWTRSLFSMAIDALRRECALRGRDLHFQLFQRYDLTDEPPATYAELAREFNITPTTVTNYLAAVRRDFRRITLAVLRDLTATEDEFQREARALLR